MKTSVVLSLLAVAVMTPLTVNAQQVYRWVDDAGRVQYSDQAPPVGTKNVQEKNVGGNSIQNNDLPLLAQDAQKKFPVTVYISECGESCDSAKAYLSKRGIPYTLVDPSRSLELNKKFKEETGGTIVPVMRVGDKRLSGWSESSWALSLDAAGYPKTPPFSKPKPVEDRAGLDAVPPKAPTNDTEKSKTAAPSKG